MILPELDSIRATAKGPQVCDQANAVHAHARARAWNNVDLELVIARLLHERKEAPKPAKQPSVRRLGRRFGVVLCGGAEARNAVLADIRSKPRSLANSQ